MKISPDTEHEFNSWRYKSDFEDYEHYVESHYEAVVGGIISLGFFVIAVILLISIISVW